MAIKIGGTTIIDDSRVLINTGNVGVGTTNPNSVVSGSNTSIVHAGIVTARELYGDGSNLTDIGFATTAGIATYTSEWIIAANGTSDYRFTGPGFTGSENDPTIYLTRGEQYKFTNNLGAHPFQIQRQFQDTGGTAYNDGIVNNGVSNGTLTWNVRMDAPDILYYQCTSHTNMSGKIYIVNAGIASDVNLFTTGISTLGGVEISAGIITATSGIVTYYGDGSNLTGIVSSISISSNVENQSQYITYATSIGGTTGLGVTTGGLTFNPSTGRMGIGATSPVTDLHILSGTPSFSPNTNFDKLVIENQNGGQGAVLQLVSPNVSEIGFSDSSRNAGLLSYNHNDNSMHFDSNNVDRVTIDSDGHIGIGTLTPTNAVATSNTKILNVGVVTANNYYGDGSNLTNLTGASAATYGSATNVAQVVVDANGRITSISNVAISGGGTNGVTIENNGSPVGTAITTINFSSNVTATASGSIATITSSGGGGGGSGTFDTGITTSVYVSVNGGIGTASIEANNDIFIGPDASFTFPATAGKSYVIESIHVTNIYNTNLYFTSRHDFNGGQNVPTTQRVVVPYQGSLELLEEPIIAKPSDVLSFQAFVGVGTTATGVNNGLDSFITYTEKDDANFIGTGVTVTTPAGTEMFTSNTNPSVIQSLRLCNYDLNIDVDASVSIYRGGSAGSIISTGVRQGYLVYNMTIPKNSVIEILERPKYLAANDTIVVGIAGTTLTDSLSATLSGKYIT